MSMWIGIERDLDSGVTTILLQGELTWSTVIAVRSALAKCVAECPVALIVDVSGLHRARSPLLSVFATAARHAAQDQGIPVLLCSPGPGIAGPLAASRAFATVYTSHADAVAAARGAAPRWVRERMASTPASVGLARILVGDACRSWDLDHLTDSARAVVSELAGNAVRHVGGDFDVTAAHPGVYLRIAVQDHSTVLPWSLAASDPHAPSAGRGSGLRTVQKIATHWGTTPVADGKIVWAALRAYPITSPPSRR